MQVEHLALNVSDVLSMARWYVEHLDFTVKRRFMEPPWGHFLADETGRVILELYTNTNITIPEYRERDPMVFHIALISHDVAADVQRLNQAGASTVTDAETLPNGDSIAMLRDPWGVPLQLVNRSETM